MKIRLLTSIVIVPNPNGQARGFGPGDEFQHPDKKEALKLIAAGYAEEIK